MRMRTRRQVLAWGAQALLVSTPVLAGGSSAPTGNPSIDLGTAIAKKDEKRALALIRAGADVNFRLQPLTAAAKTGQLTIVEALVTAGAKVNVRSIEGITALMTAVSWKQVATVEYLLSKGANANAKSKDGWTPLRYARQGLLRGIPGQVGKVWPEQKAEFQEIIRLLKAHGAKG
jgi:hypothetical protein